MRRFLYSQTNVTRVTVAVLVLFIACTASAAGEMQPYQVRVVTPGASVLSGPGEQFYPTDTLAQGDVVEVYREAPGGWLGIRPPQDSFSWVFSQHLKRLDDGLAEVDKADVPSRIGSRLSDQRNAVQVRLKKGEQVEILGETTVGDQLWYKIAPPAGEFRWIHARHVARADAPLPVYAPTPTVVPPTVVPPPVVIVPVSNEQPAPSAPPSASTSDSQPTGLEQTVTPPPAKTANDQTTWRAAPPDSSATTTEATTSTDIAAPPLATTAPSVPANPLETPITPIGVPPIAGTTPIGESVRAGSNPPSPLPAGPVADNLARQLTEIEMQLSRIVAEPPATWQIEPLAQQSNQLLQQAQSPAERAAVQSTLTKLDRFAAISRQYRQVATPQMAPTSVTTPILAGSRQPTADSPISADNQNYDAVGTLRPVVSKRPGAPQFALLNDTGQVVSFVTPTPDVNLQPYVGHRIGVTGSRGYIPEFQRAHVTAGRVSPLNERMLR